MIELIRRQQAAQSAVNRFRGQPFAYGKNDCARMAALVLRKMGHRSPLAKAGAYSSAIGAAKALKRLGHVSVGDALDAIGLVRIPPAAALPADIILIPGEGPFGGALAIAVGNGRVLGYHEDCAGAEILQPVEFISAWRT